MIWRNSQNTDMGYVTNVVSNAPITLVASVGVISPLRENVKNAHALLINGDIMKRYKERLRVLLYIMYVLLYASFMTYLIILIFDDKI